MAELVWRLVSGGLRQAKHPQYPTATFKVWQYFPGEPWVAGVEYDQDAHAREVERFQDEQAAKAACQAVADADASANTKEDLRKVLRELVATVLANHDARMTAMHAKQIFDKCGPWEIVFGK